MRRIKNKKAEGDTNWSMIAGFILLVLAIFFAITFIFKIPLVSWFENLIPGFDLPGDNVLNLGDPRNPDTLVPEGCDRIAVLVNEGNGIINTIKRQTSGEYVYFINSGTLESSYFYFDGNLESGKIIVKDFFTSDVEVGTVIASKIFIIPDFFDASSKEYQNLRVNLLHAGYGKDVFIEKLKILNNAKIYSKIQKSVCRGDEQTQIVNQWPEDLGVYNADTSSILKNTQKIIFEFRDGTYKSNLFYRYFIKDNLGYWQWSLDINEWFYCKDKIIKNVGDKNKEFIMSLVGKNYQEGIGLLISRTFTNDEGALFGNSQLYISKGIVILNNKGLFELDRAFFGKAIYFFFDENNYWRWSSDGKTWAYTSVDVDLNNFALSKENIAIIENIKKINSPPKSEDFFAGAEAIFDSSIEKEISSVDLKLVGIDNSNDFGKLQMFSSNNKNFILIESQENGKTIGVIYGDGSIWFDMRFLFQNDGKLILESGKIKLREINGYSLFYPNSFKNSPELKFDLPCNEESFKVIPNFGNYFCETNLRLEKDKFDYIKQFIKEV
ncbi:MAG: hypothetical protein WC796_01690 [Candidatus Pacearchaeota archaeon]|jgi:hypothetical protein